MFALSRLIRIVMGWLVVGSVVVFAALGGGCDNGSGCLVAAAGAESQPLRTTSPAQQQQRHYRISQFLSPDLEASLSLLQQEQEQQDQEKKQEEEEDVFASHLSSYFSIVLHRNGEPDACGSTVFSLPLLDQALESLLLYGDDNNNNDNNGELNRYQVESLLTELVHQQEKNNKDEIIEEEEEGGRWLCPSLEVDIDTKTTTTASSSLLSGFLGYCDMGPDRTVPQPDSDHLVPVPSSGSLPCRFYTREGLRITSLNQLATLVLIQDSDSSSFSEQQQQHQQQSCTSESADPTSCNNSNSTGSCSQSKETTMAMRSLDLYAVPAGRVFMFPARFVGEQFELPHIIAPAGVAASSFLEVLSINPRVFEIHNFFSNLEADQLIQRALREKSESNKLHRSTTGTVGKNVYNRRTSENAWATHGGLATSIKKRCMSALGFDDYYESHTDGLQILRYNFTNAYVSHMDYLTAPVGGEYDFDSRGRGGNRFATILLYMSDMEEGWGGETCFPKGERYYPLEAITSIAASNNNSSSSSVNNDNNSSTILKENNNGDDDDRVSKEEEQKKKKMTKTEMIAYLRQQGELDGFVPGSWEEDMVGVCRTRLAVTPRKTRAVLFYSQFPNGTPDPASLHGACPVLKGTKWAANLWAWNAAREDFNFAPLKAGGERRPKPQEEEEEEAFPPVKAEFVNSGSDPNFRRVALYWQDEYFGDLSAGKTVHVNTFVGHVWNLKHPDTKTTLHTWTMDHATTQQQSFIV